MDVAEIFNNMANDYDEIRDLWYAWLFSRLHYIIVKEVITVYNPKVVLDVGCGTGFQSFLHAISGNKVVGIDIAKDLIEVAQKKISSFKPQNEIVLFPVHFKFVDRYNKLISTLLNKQISSGNYTPPKFLTADAKRLPFSDESFDHVNCCGSTLSFVDKHHVALSEIARVLKPGGSFLLEVEARWNIDLLWGVLDALIMGKLGYENSFKEACKMIFISPKDYVYTEYPFGSPENPVYMKLKLFTASGLKRELSSLKLEVLKKWTIHSVTNLIPSTYLDLNNPPKSLRHPFAAFAKIEERMPISLPGCSLVFLARKENMKKTLPTKENDLQFE
jgi:ubiquinone/menaquinone biosynthesis C-methylase UbiE